MTYAQRRGWRPDRWSARWLSTAVAAVATLAGCGGGDGHSGYIPPSPSVPPATAALTCDDSIKAGFKPDANTTVLAVKAYKKGDQFPNDTLEALFFPNTSTAKEDLCLVKLLVGPGNPGPAGAPSTSAGIGIEIWLPAKEKWNGRVHAVGGGGWVGSFETDPTKISNANATVDQRSAATVAGEEGAVSSSTDAGYTFGGDPSLGGSFAMNPDGTINTRLWEDFAERSIYEQIVKTKALAKAYYGSAPKYTYWDAASKGGQQSLKVAQRYPDEVDGIVVGNPAINWTKFITADLYPQIVIQRDLGGNYMSAEQLGLVSNAAITSCDLVGGKHLGFIVDPASCHYDPTTDANVLCAANGGNNSTAACVAPAQALAINKIWYGMTSDGSVPDPATDNGSGALTGNRKWYGVQRGSNLSGLAGPAPFAIAAEMTALELQDPRLAPPSFKNATGNGQDGWKSLSYAQLANAFDIGVALQPQFSRINSDDPDLSAFKVRGGKMIHVVGEADSHIPTAGSVDYYERVVTRMGGLSAVQPFYRMYKVPGMGHAPLFLPGTINSAEFPPVPDRGQVYALLMDWVEKGIAPDSQIVKTHSSASAPKSLPLCVYPKKITYVSGDSFQASSYTCQ